MLHVDGELLLKSHWFIESIVVVVALSEQEGQEDVEEGKKRNIIYLTLCDIIIVIPSRG